MKLENIHRNFNHISCNAPAPGRTDSCADLVFRMNDPNKNGYPSRPIVLLFGSGILRVESVLIKLFTKIKLQF